MGESRKQDEDYATLYEREFHRMARTVSSLLRGNRVPQSAVDAEDVVQEAFMKALPHSEVRDRRSYVYKIIQRDVARISRRFESTEPLSESCEHTPGVLDLGDYVAIHIGLSKLSQRQRAAVWLTAGLRHRRHEAARMLNCSPGSIARHVSRGVKALTMFWTIVLLMASAIWAMITSVPGDPFDFVPAPDLERMDW